MPGALHIIPIVTCLVWTTGTAGQIPPAGEPVQQGTATTQEDTLLVKRILELEARLAEFESRYNRQQRESAQQALRDRAQQMSQQRGRGQGGRGAGGAGQDPRSVIFTSAQRQLNDLNPELSFSGNFMGWIRSPETAMAADGTTPLEPAFAEGNRFWLREAEISVIAPLDPYTRGKFFFGIPSDGGDFAIEEAYMNWINLPTDLNLKIGYFRNQFGQLNRWHDHALPQADRPHVLLTFLGGETGLVGLGASGNWVLPRLWSHVNEVTVEHITGGDGISFSDNLKNGRVTLGRMKNYWDLSANTYFELGLSGAYGYNDAENLYETRLAGLDINYKWVPAGRGHYRTFELRAEAITSLRETPTGNVQSWGGYVSVQNKLNARLWTSLRADYTQLPDDAGQNISALAFTLDYWQSEFVFFRIQIDRIERTFADNENRLLFQTVWSMGPHKHEAY